MKNLLLYTFFLLSTISTSAQVPVLHVQDTLGNDHLLANVVDTNKNHLIVFWGSWSFNSKKLLDEWKPYSQNWIDHYNIEILCVSAYYDTSQIQIAKDLWHDKGWIGKLFFTSTTDLSNIGIEAVPWTLLITPEDSTIYTHIGYTSGDVIETNDFIVNNLPLGTDDVSTHHESIKIYHDNNTLRIESQDNLKGCTLDIYTIDGKRLFTCNIESNTTEYEVQETMVLNNAGLYVVLVKQGSYSKSSIIFQH